METSDIIETIENYSALEFLYKLKENKNYDRSTLKVIADYFEQVVSPAELWKCLKPAFTETELMENLIYLAKELDL